jgi:DNA-binding CsgD family transcriptional regulator
VKELGKYADLFQKAVELFRQGKNCMEVSRELKIRSNKVSSIAVAAFLLYPDLPTSCGRNKLNKIFLSLGPNPINTVKKMLEDGKTWEEIAKLVGYKSPKSISIVFNIVGVKSPKLRFTKISAEELEKLIMLHDNCKKLAGALGISPSTVYRAARRLGVRCKPQNRIQQYANKLYEALSTSGGYAMDAVILLHKADLLKVIYTSFGSLRRFLMEISTINPSIKWMYIKTLGTRKYKGVLRRLRQKYLLWISGKEDEVVKEILRSAIPPYKSLKVLLKANGAPPEIIEALERLQQSKKR